MSTSHETRWSKDESRSEWLREEYRLLSEHYFHEDNYIHKVISFYAGLSGGLLAFMGSTFAGSDATVNQMIAAIGVIISVSWLLTVIRIRETRQYISSRIARIEKELHSGWPSDDFVPLDIKTQTKWRDLDDRRRWFNAPYFWARELPSSFVLMFLPVAFMAGWVALLAFDWL